MLRSITCGTSTCDTSERLQLRADGEQNESRAAANDPPPPHLNLAPPPPRWKTGPTVSEAPHAVGRHPDVFVLVLLGFLSLLPQTIVILHKLHHLLHLLPHVDTLVLSVLVCVGTHRGHVTSPEDSMGLPRKGCLLWSLSHPKCAVVPSVRAAHRSKAYRAEGKPFSPSQLPTARFKPASETHRYSTSC